MGRLLLKNLKVGDELEVTKILHGHHFEVGAIIKVTDTSDTDFEAEGIDEFGKFYAWFLRVEEVKRAKTEKS